MFKCPRCLSLDCEVKEGRYHKKSNNYIRIRQCKNCGFRFFTTEKLLAYSVGLNKMSDCYRDKNKEKSKRECKT